MKKPKQMTKTMKMQAAVRSSQPWFSVSKQVLRTLPPIMSQYSLYVGSVGGNDWSRSIGAWGPYFPDIHVKICLVQAAVPELSPETVPPMMSVPVCSLEYSIPP